MPRVTLIEALGLLPLDKSAREARLALAGDAATPKTRFDLSSLRQLQPRFAIPLWLGKRPRGRLVPVTNLFNHRQPPPELGWSVRVTRVRDFTGGANTYDSHNGTDFAVPPGTDVVAAAPGRVIRVSREFHRGGLKVFLDHGGGLATSYNHLARALVAPGDTVARGQAIALSGYSGIDAVVGFPWTPPHVHFNVWLDGAYVDPFPHDGAPSLWRGGAAPVPAAPGEVGASDCAPTAWREAAVGEALEACVHDEARAEIEAAPTLEEKAGTILFLVNYFPTRFTARPRLYPEAHARAPRLDLPFSHRDYDGAFFPSRGPARG
ncbi:MAG: M23 family metallopeptidase [Sandaracinaceae bacterium]|nr:M23 family metallopeptidase [Sandaracinaceae bacterium]